MFQQDVGYRAALTVRHTEIALHRAAQELVVLHRKGLIEAKHFTQPFNVGLGAFLPQHVVYRIPDKAKHRKRHQPHDQ